jgi:osmoprotectant transport system permease protein
MPAGPFLDYVDPWINWDWLSNHVPLILDRLQEHAVLTLIAVVVGFAISLPIGVFAYRWTAFRNPVLTVSGILYTIPSLALFAFLVPYTGAFSITTAEIPLISYTVLILVRNVIVGLDGVPADVKDAADGMGYRPMARLVRVEIPLALPAIFAGLRIATVTTIGLVTITFVIGLGGLGQLIYTYGLLQNNFHTAILLGIGLTLALAFIADGALLVAQRLALPWARTA